MAAAVAQSWAAGFPGPNARRDRYPLTDWFDTHNLPADLQLLAIRLILDLSVSRIDVKNVYTRFRRGYR